MMSALEYAATHRVDNLRQLFELLSIPSISTDPAHKEDVERAAQWLVDRVQALGMERVELFPTDGHPIVYSEWMGAGEDAPTLLIYGHYDVQPTDPDDAWISPPFKPVVRDGYVYARGASDDKGQFLAHVAAVESFLRSGDNLPVNIKFCIEGEEEMGSPHIADFIGQHQDMLTCDASLISDTAWLNPETPAIIYGVRGLVYAEIEIRGPKHDLHSGSYGGAVHNPLQVAAEMLAALHDERGRVAIPGFYDHVRPLDEEERAELGRLPFDEERFLRQEVGAPTLWEGEEGYTVLERLGARPTLEIHGIGGGYTGAGGKTVIPASAVLKVSMRLVPDQDPDEIAALFEQHIHTLAPPTVEVEVRIINRARGAVIERDTPAMQAAVEAYRKGFGLEPVLVRAGGSIHIVSVLQHVLKVPPVMMGLGLPDDNLHAPNEKFLVQHFYQGIETSIHFMERLTAQHRRAGKRQ